MSWESICLSDIAEFSNGVNFRKESYGKGVKLISVSDFGNRFYPNYSDLEEIKANVVRSSDYLENGDIIFVRSNGNKELVGRCMLINDVPCKTTYSGFCIRCRVKDQAKVFPKYLAYYFKTNVFRQAIAGNTVGANIQNLSQGRLSSHCFNLPDLPTQHRIASILSAYDDLIENNQKQIKLLEEAAQRLYKEWFVDLRFPGWENTKIVDGVPEGWTCTKLGKVLKTFSGSTPSRQNNEYYQDGSIPWLKTKELNDRFILSTEEKITETALKSTSVHIIEKESVIMAMYGATIGKLGISTSALTCNQACCVFDLTVSPLTNEFLFSWLYHKKPYLISLGKGAAQPNLSQEFIQSIDIILPPSIFIEEYTRLTHPFFQSIKNNQEKIEHLSILRNQLLKNLLH